MPFRRSAAVAGLAAMTFVSCGGGGSGVTPSGAGSTPTAPPTPTPTPTGTNSTAYTCPTSDTASAVARGSVAAHGDAMRRGILRSKRTSGASSTLVAVTYDRATAARSAAAISSRERSAGTTVARSLDFPHLGLTTHVLAVPAGKSSSVIAAFRSQAGVKSVAATGYRRTPSVVTTPYFPNDPYFNGFSGSGTFHVGPYEEAAAVPGEWDMHAIGLEDAFAYSQAGNGSGVSNANALGLASVKIAVIDTGQGTTHPELSGKIIYQKCYITSADGTTQSTSGFTTDPFGHGTDVAGIAAENTGNAFGFTGAGGNVSIMGYRVFPTPDDSCAGENGDNQCSSDSTDIASAIEDAVANGASVISMSLGGENSVAEGGCSSAGVDEDPVEGAAVADAIAANVIVVAASGNDGTSPSSAAALEAPACDAGVIAVGASALADGQPNGTNSDGSGEYVAYYSDSGSSTSSPKSAAAWGIVAPGGDPSSDNDNDDLHWIENIWTSTPFQASSGDQTFAGNCVGDFPAETGTVDCRTLIAGTSMATPHVAGAVALILSVNSAYKSPSAMKTLLCTTADDIADPHEGCGRLNIYRAMAHAVGDPSPPT
jgi:hypothetical protein